MPDYASITHLRIDDIAPAFQLYDQDGNIFKLGKKNHSKIILYFYPNDDSQTCTKEACNFRDHFKLLENHGYQIVGVSHADIISKKKFAVKYQLPFTLLSDPEYRICKLYGVFGDKFFMGKMIQTIHRITFVISKNGKIEKIIYPVKSGNAAFQILEI